jgi:hypothetical protein
LRRDAISRRLAGMPIAPVARVLLQIPLERLRVLEVRDAVSLPLRAAPWAFEREIRMLIRNHRATPARLVTPIPQAERPLPVVTFKNSVLTWYNRQKARLPIQDRNPGKPHNGVAPVSV